MTPARFDELQNTFPPAARLVLSVVPIGEAWTKQQVQQELARQGKVQELCTVTGWLNKLVSCRLVDEPARGKFQRAKVREKAQAEPVPEQPQEPEEVKAPKADAVEQKKPGQLDRLAAISAELRREGDRLMKLADAIDAAALLTEDEIAAIGEDTKKLRQLQELLRGLGQ